MSQVFQQERNAAERQMTQWQRDELDRKRERIACERAANPALFEMLDRIDAKLNMLIPPPK